MIPLDDASVESVGRLGDGAAEAVAIVASIVGAAVLVRYGAGRATAAGVAALVLASARRGLLRHAASAWTVRWRDRLARATAPAFALLPLVVLWRWIAMRATPLDADVDLALGAGAYVVAALQLVELMVWRVTTPTAEPEPVRGGSAAYYPLLLDLRGRLVVVIGGGALATQKVRELRACGARVRVVSPNVCDALAALVAQGDTTLVRRAYVDGDLAGARLAIAATDDRAVNAAVWREADASGVPLNAVDDVAHCHFIVPSVHRAGDVTIAVSTAGACPALAVRLREQLGALVGAEHAALASLAGTWRPEVARRVPSLDARRRLWYRIVDDVALRAHLRADRREDAERAIEAHVAAAERGEDVARRGEGRVALVGAGPGDPGLLTVRARELLAEADVVAHDRLVSADVLALAHPGARLVDVGKHGHGHSTSQEAIDALLVREARAGRRIVRLKGGDPFVFGRGAEERAHLRAAGVAVEVVPGISSAIAAPGAAGIPVTHRALASGFAVVTGHECNEHEPRDDVPNASRLDWSALARMPTLVVLMGLRALPRVVDRLLASGASPDVPAAVIARATTADQRVVVGTLASIASRAAAADVPQPATLVVGRVVDLAGDGLPGAEAFAAWEACVYPLPRE